MISDPSDAAIDQIVASCNGDLRGALKALLLVNEHLEAELQPILCCCRPGQRIPRQVPALVSCTGPYREQASSSRATCPLASIARNQMSRPSTFSVSCLTICGTFSR
ncbi:hypothetical protein ACVWY2_005150 [Bradyrhizobium sp. JR6.1]